MLQLLIGIKYDILVCTAFRKTRRPIPAPPLDPGSGQLQDPHDEEYMDARPDKEDMEEAIENFLSRLERVKKSGASGTYTGFCQSCPCLN